MKKTVAVKERIEALDINLTLALFKCFTEQLHTLKGKNSYSVKQKFGRLIKAARQYEKEIDDSIKNTEGSSVEDIYDALMDMILEGREAAIKKFKSK